MRRSDGWGGTTQSFGEAIKLARRGWPEGAVAISSMIDQANFEPEFVDHIDNTQAFIPSIGGVRPSVPLWCSGDPEYMLDIVEYERETMQGAAIRLYAQMQVSGYNSGAKMATFGAAVCLLCDRLERIGHRVEIVLVSRVGTGIYDNDWRKNRSGCPYTEINSSITVKSYSQNMDLATLAFVFANPSFYRRLYFRHYEIHDELYSSMNQNYGLPKAASSEMLMPGVMLPTIDDIPYGSFNGVIDCYKALVEQYNMDSQHKVED